MRDRIDDIYGHGSFGWSLGTPWARCHTNHSDFIRMLLELDDPDIMPWLRTIISAVNEDETMYIPLDDIQWVRRNVGYPAEFLKESVRASYAHTSDEAIDIRNGFIEGMTGTLHENPLTMVSYALNPQEFRYDSVSRAFVSTMTKINPQEFRYGESSQSSPYDINHDDVLAPWIADDMVELVGRLRSIPSGIWGMMDCSMTHAEICHTGFTLLLHGSSGTAMESFENARWLMSHNGDDNAIITRWMAWTHVQGNESNDWLERGNDLDEIDLIPATLEDMRGYVLNGVIPDGRITDKSSSYLHALGI